mgnify:FL=1
MTGVERFTPEWERGYVGPRVYRCPRCEASYTHDQAYRHAVLGCPGASDQAQKGVACG